MAATTSPSPGSVGTVDRRSSAIERASSSRPASRATRALISRCSGLGIGSGAAAVASCAVAGALVGVAGAIGIAVGAGAIGVAVGAGAISTLVGAGAVVGVAPGARAICAVGVGAENAD